jgi:metallo-beta-lactamase class B
MQVKNKPGGIPKRDMDAGDGQKLTLGDTTITIMQTPGHTMGTLSYLIPVTDNGKKLTAAYSGGMGFNFARSPERFDTYIASADKMRMAAKAAGASIVFSNHSMYDMAWTRSRVARKPGDESPFVIGAEAVDRYFTVLRECAVAGKARLKK